ncbi:MAG: DUF362 domain-containing protein [Ruminococcaceae bacterium]|nr:DUF362 domain-containing protein [Oscillospiraceae bacterium]
MEKSKVVLCRCESYGEAENAVFRALAELDAPMPQKDKRILLKPNLLTKASPDKAVTTHPAVFGAVGKYLRDKGYSDITYGDSPGTHFMGTLQISTACGIHGEAEKLGIPLADFEGGEEMPYPDGKSAKSFIICNGVREADAIVNICKMKTHMLERMTGAQKNLFGIVYGFNKGATHVKYPNSVAFAKALADLNNMFPPVLHVMDAVDAMEGNGPSGGTVKHMGWILASTDPVALDTVACCLMDLAPQLVPTNTYGESYGVGNTAFENIEVVLLTGEREVTDCATVREKYGVKDFDVYRGAADKGKIKHLAPFEPLLRKKPVIDKDKCVGCGICVESCPAEKKAVTFKDGAKIPAYDYKLCIRCFCCQEMCPKHAISAKVSPLARFIDRNWKI